MSPDASSSRDLTRRLVARAAADSGGPEAAALAVHAASESAYRELTRSLGSAGSHALITRALAQAAAEHPVLRGIHVGRQPEPGLGGVFDAVQTHGIPAVAAGLEALLQTLLGLVGRLIGNDMVARLLESDASMETLDDEEVR